MSAFDDAVVLRSTRSHPGGEVPAQDACPDCGERNPPQSAFCVFCGAYLGWNEEDSLEESPSDSSLPLEESTTSFSHEDDAPTQVVQPSEPVFGWVDPVRQAPQPPPPVLADTQTACPRCGHPNDRTRRFCNKCGQPLRPVHERAPGQATPTPVPGFWQRLSDPAARAARRNYRRSLPWWRRGRRVLFGLLGIVVAVAVLVAIRRDAVGWVRDHVFDNNSAQATTPHPTHTPTKTGPSVTRPYPGPPPFAVNDKRTAYVRSIQTKLKSKHYRIAVDGYYGPQTQHTVRQFQKDEHLPITGEVGRLTWVTLFQRPATQEPHG